MSISAASTPAFLSASAVKSSIMPVCTMTVRPSSCLIFAMACVKRPIGTEPFGRQPPLMRQPKAPSCFSAEHVAKSVSGVLAGCMVWRSLPPQCLQFNAQFLPVTDIVGNWLGLEQ